MLLIEKHCRYQLPSSENKIFNRAIVKWQTQDNIIIWRPHIICITLNTLFLLDLFLLQFSHNLMTMANHFEGTSGITSESQEQLMDPVRLHNITHSIATVNISSTPLPPDMTFSDAAMFSVVSYRYWITMHSQETHGCIQCVCLTLNIQFIQSPH